jgi:hypothetical protein
MCIGEPFEKAPHDLVEMRRRDAFPPFQKLLYRAPLEELHYEVRCPIRELVVVGDANDVRVVELRQDANLVEEPAPKCRVGCEMGMDDLGDCADLGLLHHLEDDPHPPLAELPDDYVLRARETIADGVVGLLVSHRRRFRRHFFSPADLDAAIMTRSGVV